MTKYALNAVAWKEACATFSERAMQIVMEEVNNALPEIVQNVQKHYEMQGIKKITGRLYARTEMHKMEVADNRVKYAYVINDVTNMRTVKRPGKKNPNMRNRYKDGVSYGRLIEFSPRINKPFFYPAVNESKQILANRIKKRWQNEKLL